MNILVVCREIPPVGGGAGHVAIHLAEEVVKAGHRVEIVTMHYGDLPEYEEREGSLAEAQRTQSGREGTICIHRVKCGRKNQDSSYLLEMARFAARARPLLDRIAESRRCDVIHAHAIVPDGWMGVGPSGKLGMPLVLTAHGSDVPGYNPDKFKLAHALMRPFWNRTLNHAAAVVAPSNHLANMIHSVRPEQPVKVIPNGIRENTFSAVEKDDSFLVVSRLVRRKNYHLFLEALRSVTAPQTVHVVGEGPMLDELKEIAATLDQHRVVFHGWLRNGSDEWRDLYQKCRYFVFPSESENFPINLLEAQLAGMIVLASHIPGICEVVGNEAVFFDALDVEGMAATLNGVLSGATRRKLEAMAVRGRQRVREQFSWHTIAKQYSDLYGALLEGNRQ